MKSTSRWILVMALALAPAPLMAQGLARGHDASVYASRSRVADPVRSVLDHRRELRLTSSQVKRLEQAQRQLDQRNAALERQLSNLRDDDRGRSGSNRAVRQDARARERADRIRDQLRRNADQAAEQVGRILTARQRQLASRYTSGGYGGWRS